MLWVPRIMLALPLPPFWNKQISNKTEGSIVIYKDLESGSMFNFHPAELFIIKLLNRLRLAKADPSIGRKELKERQKTQENFIYKKLKFVDSLKRVYTCTGQYLLDLYQNSE